MVTMVEFEKSRHGRFFKIKGTLRQIIVQNVEDGIATVVPTPGTDIEYFAKVVAGCFAEGSNFEAEVKKAFNTEQEIVCIKPVFNDVELLTVTRYTTETKIYSSWAKKMA